ncbi:hypothetical protein JCM21900_003827 [Sporobolomyces salmonicolor]
MESPPPDGSTTSVADPIVCNACKQGLEETQDNTVVSFGKYLFHVDCRCAKCHNLVEHDTNLLLLSDGSPVCENCSYICSVCQKPIHNEAIVTGDESYHADCFRCRSCANKIEELIFAKTTQGIWCMACHNERVARTRKHAEAKRSRTARKSDKEGSRSSRSRGDREHRERDRDREKSAGGASEPCDVPDLPTAPSSISLDLGATPAVRPLPPSPADAQSSSSPYTDPTTHRRTKTTPGDAPRHSPSIDLPPSGSTQSISALATHHSPTPLTAPSSTHVRTPSQLSVQASEPSDQLQRTSGGARRQDLVGGTSGRSSGEGTSELRDFQANFSSPPQGAVDSFRLHPEPRSPTSSDSTSRQGSLSAPVAVDKAANRRSGFYGRPSINEEGGRASLDEPAAATTITLRTPPSTDPAPPPQPYPPSNPNATADLHGSVSFYDPDSLLFLDHIGSAPSSPKHAPKAPPEIITGTDGDDPEEQLVEHLSRRPDSAGEEADAGGAGSAKSEVARKVRESIQLVKRESSGGAGGAASASQHGLDVELVEMLLAELEGTKKEMSELQSKYNAFRRASRSAFEGFSMAREEYDKEVAARREAEQKMEILRAKFLEQAKRLAQVDQEQQAAETLKRQSKDLRTSVVGMEKHLSQLKAEVALSTAQIAELAALGKDDSAPGDRSSSASAAHDELAEALNARLETVKDAHRDEINGLVAQRDDLLREIAELRQARDTLLEDNTVLTTRNAELFEKNAEATRQFEVVQDQTSKLRLVPPSSATASASASGRSGHSHTPSSSSLLSNLPGAGRSPLATARVIGSPSELNESFRFAKPEAVEAHTRNKFKWGKGKSSEAARSNSPLPPTSLSKSPVVPRTGASIDQGARSHVFQQVSILRPVRCDYCGDKMWGLNEVRCNSCGSYAHAKCAGYLQGGCHSGGSGTPPITQDETLNFTPTGPPIFGGDLIAQANAEGRDVPVVVTKCIDAVEAYGMNYEGIYRKTGGMGQTKLITQHFERGVEFDLEDRDKFNDLAAVTSCMKNYFRALPNPLFTHDLHEEFVAAVELQDAEARLAAIEQALYKLPLVHFQTARLLFQHLHRIHLLAAENKMTSANLGVVFGPTVLRSAVAAREWSDMGPKAKIVEILCDHADKLFTLPHPGAAAGPHPPSTTTPT